METAQNEDSHKNLPFDGISPSAARLHRRARAKAKNSKQDLRPSSRCNLLDVKLHEYWVTFVHVCASACHCSRNATYLDSSCDSILCSALSILSRQADEKKSVSVDVKCIYHMCLDGSKGGRSEARRYLQDCVGGSSPLYPALCSFTSKPNNLRPTHNCISSVGKSHWKG